ncbi:MAG: YceD family protein [Chromatiales bacterium]|nr:YceD family protein [Chromatiales bacterium]
MSTVLPDHIDPWRAAKNGLSFAGELPLTRFPRLLEVGIVDEGEAPAHVTYRLDFGRDAQRGTVLEGWARLRLRLLCQRCLSDVWLDLDAPLALRLVRIEANAKGSENDYEALVVTDDSLDPFELIEDELLLAIPPFPRHPVGECQAPEPASGDGSAASEPDRPATEEPERAPNPFAVLERLKQH